MLKSKRLVAMPVISLENGEELGKVKSLLLDPSRLVVSGLILGEQKKLFKDQKVILFENVEHVGEDAVTVSTAATIQKISQSSFLAELAKNPCSLIGSRVMTEEGKVLGTIAEYYLDTTNGSILSLELSGSLADKFFKGFAALEISAVKTVGRDVVIVSKSAEELLKHNENPLQETVKTIKDRSSRILDNTLETTKKLGTNVNRSWENIRRKQSSSKDEDEVDDEEK